MVLIVMCVQHVPRLSTLEWSTPSAKYGNPQQIEPLKVGSIRSSSQIDYSWSWSFSQDEVILLKDHHEGSNNSSSASTICSKFATMNYTNSSMRLNDVPDLAGALAASVHRDREKERLYEEERQKWVLSYEEKSSMIEQLERELMSTVDALNKEKQEKTEAQHELIQSSRRGSSSPYPRRSSDYRIGKNSPGYDASNSPNIRNIRIDPSKVHLIENDNSNHRILELLRQSQEETALVRRDLTNFRKETNLMSDQILDQKRQINRLIEENEQIAKSLQNSNSKVLLRDQQISEFEAGREGNRERETKLSDLITALERQLSRQTADISKFKIDLQSARTDVISLEQFIDQMSRKSEDKDLLGNVPLSSESMQNRFLEMERIAIEVTRRAESAERSLYTLIAAEPVTLGTAPVPNSFHEASSFEMVPIPATPCPVPVDMEPIHCLQDSVERSPQNYSDSSYHWRPAFESGSEDCHRGASVNFEQNAATIEKRSVEGQIVDGPPQQKTSSRVRKKLKDASTSPGSANRLVRGLTLGFAVSEDHNARRCVGVDRPRCSGPSVKVVRSQNISQGSECISQRSGAFVGRKENPHNARTRPFTPSEKSRAIRECSRMQSSSRSVPLIGRNPRTCGAHITAAAKACLPKRKLYRENTFLVRYESQGGTGWSNVARTTGDTESGRVKRRNPVKTGRKLTDVPSLREKNISPLTERTRRRSIQVRIPTLMADHTTVQAPL